MGKVTYTTRISTAHLIGSQSDFKPEKFIQEQIDLILTLLPKGSYHTSTETHSSSDLSVPYILAFESPAYKDGTTIELNYFRSIYVDEKAPEGKQLIQFNQFVGMRFFKPDGTEMYK